MITKLLYFINDFLDKPWSYFPLSIEALRLRPQCSFNIVLLLGHLDHIYWRKNKFLLLLFTIISFLFLFLFLAFRTPVSSTMPSSLLRLLRIKLRSHCSWVCFRMSLENGHWKLHKTVNYKKWLLNHNK